MRKPKTGERAEENNVAESAEGAEGAHVGSSSEQDATGEIAELADSILDEQPEVSEHAIEQAQASAEAKNATESATFRDKDGNTFDATLHATGVDGKPVLTAKGIFRRRRGARKRTGQSYIGGGSSATPGVAIPANVPSPEQRQKARASAVVCVNTLVMFGGMIGGEEWQPVKIDGFDERANLEQAFEDCALAYGWTDIPPWAGLAIAVAAYAAPRFTRPKTKAKLSAISATIRNRFKGDNGARAHSGNDGKRENNAGKTSGDAVSGTERRDNRS